MNVSTAKSGLSVLEAAGAVDERIQGRLYRFQAGNSVSLLSLGVLVDLYRLRRDLDEVHKLISHLSIETEEEREMVRKTIALSKKVMVKADVVQKKYIELVEKSRPWIKFHCALNIRLFEDLVCSAEDAVETLSLAMDRKFIALIEDDLRSVNA